MLLIKRLLFLFLFFHQAAVSQQFNYNIINTEKGLPSSEVYAVLEDKRGYMWFATDHGVARYNGKEFTTYTTEDGLLDNTVLRMCEDAKGRIWFGSLSNELCYWEKDSIHTSPASAMLKKRFRRSSVIHTLHVDSADNIWVAGVRETVVLKAKQNFQCFDIPVNLDIDGTNFKVIPLEKTKGMVAGHALKHPYINPDIPLSFLFQFDTYQDNDIHFRYLDIRFKDVVIDMDRSECAVLDNDTYYFSLANILYIIKKGKAIVAKKFDHPILKLMIDHDRNLWIGFLKGGAVCYKNCDLKSQPLCVLENYSIDDMCVDHEGGAWLASLEKGVLYIPSVSILTYSNVPYLNDHITLLSRINNQVYINTLNNTICRATDQQIVIDSLLYKLGKINLQLAHIASIRDTTYLSFALNLVRLTPRVIYPKLTDISRRIKSGKAVFHTEENFVWVMQVGSLVKFDTKTERFVIFPSQERITCTLPYGKSIFVGTKKGTYLFENGKYLSLDFIDPLLKKQVADMVLGKDSSIWIATTGNGLLRLKDKKVIQISSKDGLISNTCTTIATDIYGNIWVGTTKGLSCIIYSGRQNQKWLIKNITTKNGVTSNEITKLVAAGNTLWVGTMWGLNAVNISEIVRPIPPSPAYISAVKVNNNPVVNGQQSFPYNENNFRFNLTGLTFKDNGEHTFRYRLLGFDNLWQETQSNELLLNNLDPGSYSLQIQVRNEDKIWSNSSASYSFKINKPFWLTWWFIVLDILCLIFIVYLIILWRTSIIKKKEKEKLRINKLLTEYQMKALTAQMNPHFIFNAINSIQNFIIQNHSTLAYDYLIKFSKLIRLVLNNSKDNEITLQQELDTLALYIELEQLRFKDSFDYKLHIDQDIDTQSLMTPALLLQPYIENAIWHGLMPLKTHKGKITLIITRQEQYLKIIITDNGVGRRASNQIKKKITHRTHQSVGMELTGKRIELFGQERQFSIQIIDNYDNNDNSTGTTVEIILPMVEMY